VSVRESRKRAYTASRFGGDNPPHPESRGDGLYTATHDCGNTEGHKLERRQLTAMKQSCQRQCFSTLNHNLSYCYDAGRVIKWLWRVARTGFREARSFED
jgi:hypothetical protein